MRCGLRAGSSRIAVGLAGRQSAPVAGRKQFMLVPDSRAIEVSARAYDQVLAPIQNEGKLNRNPAMKARVDRITARLVAQAIKYRPETAELVLAPSHQGAAGGVEKLLQRRTIPLQKNQVSAEFQNRNADHYHTVFWGHFHRCSRWEKENCDGQVCSWVVTRCTGDRIGDHLSSF